MHPKPIRNTLKSNSYLTLIFRRGPVNSSSPIFPNINFTKTMTNLLVVSKITEKWLQLSLFPLLYLLYELQVIFLFDVTFTSWLGKSVNPNFRQYQSDRNNNKFNCCLRNYSEMATRISICTLNPLKLRSNQIHTKCQLSVVARKIRQPPLFSISRLVDLKKTKQKQNQNIHIQVLGKAGYSTCSKFQGKLVNPTLVGAPGTFSFLNKRHSFWRTSLCQKSFTNIFQCRTNIIKQ